jgi:PIN domain nuclease of toxin-antitoxin system
MQNVVLNYHNMVTGHDTRQWKNGFLNFYGKSYENNRNYLPVYPGMKHHPSSVGHIPSVETKECQKEESRSAFILSNDDIYNLGHYMNEVIGIWAMMVLANHDERGPGNGKQSSSSLSEKGREKNSILINIDGYRYGGPAGGPPHRLMEVSRPDEHGPYSEQYYSKWFGEKEVFKGRDFEKQSICYRNLYIFPLPGIPWFWNEWSRDDECSFVAASPLYQSFNVYLRQKLLDDYYEKEKQSKNNGNNAMATKKLVFPSELPYYHIVIEVRSIKNNNRNGHSSARFIKNLQSLISTLESLQVLSPTTKVAIPIKVTAQDFGKLSFSEQIHLAHTASVLVSMHGAGTTHIFHMAIGDRKCCGLMELFPDTTVELYTAKGYGNLARQLGLKHERYVTEKGQTTSDGSFVNVGEIKQLVGKILERIVDEDGTCLHNVKDTRHPVFPSSIAL